MSYTDPVVQTTGDFITASIWNIIVNAIALQKTSLDDNGNISPPAATTLTLSANVSGAVTPTQNVHAIDTNAAAAAGDLATLTIAGAIRAGHLLVLYAANVAHIVTLRDGTGNVALQNGDFAFDTVKKIILLQLVGTTWREVARSVAGLPPYADPVWLSGIGLGA